MCARPKAGRAVAGGVRARACGAGQAGAGASECWWGGSWTSVPRGDSPATDRTCPRASPGLAYICEGLKEQRKGLATLVLWNNQLTHTGMAFLGMTLVSRPERGGGQRGPVQHLSHPRLSSSSGCRGSPSCSSCQFRNLLSSSSPVWSLLQLLHPLSLEESSPSFVVSLHPAP